MSELPTGTVTFLFADVEGSTRLMESLGDRYEDVLRDYRSIARSVLGGAGGREIDTQGDAFFFSFARARDAVAGAVDMQNALAEHAWTDGASVRVRMGLHTGEPAVGTEGYHGLDVVRAARICSAGHGGQILVSETTRALIGNNLPSGVQVVDLGHQPLKDIQHERIYQLALPGQADRFPPLKTEDRPRSKGETQAEELADRFERRIDAFVSRQLERSLGGGFPDLAALDKLERRQRRRRGRGRSPGGLIVRVTALVLLAVLAAALLVYVIRALF